jgi:hypothetical protein
MLGVQLLLLIGKTLPIPAPNDLIQALETIEVTQNDEGRSGFQITFRAGRAGFRDLLDDRLLQSSRLNPMNRVIIAMIFGVVPQVVFDGIITHRQFMPGAQIGGSTLTVTGEDVSIMMDLEEQIREHPAQNEVVIANKLILSYAQYGLSPLVIPPLSFSVPNPVQRIPVQHATDLNYLNQLAELAAYVFYVMPGPLPGMNIGYWGPPVRAGLPQPALTVNMGSATNVDSINFQENGLAATTVKGAIQDSLTNRKLPVRSLVPTRLPLSRGALLSQPRRTRQYVADTGVNVAEAMGRVAAELNRSVDDVVTATGELDGVRYGHVLRSRGLVGVRGVGDTYGGLYYVKSVTHQIRPGSYKQSFTLTRDGTGTTTPILPT